jgi:hypothetical protein
MFSVVIAVEGSSPPREGVTWTKWLDGLLLLLRSSFISTIPLPVMFAG